MTCAPPTRVRLARALLVAAVPFVAGCRATWVDKVSIGEARGGIDVAGVSRLNVATNVGDVHVRRGSVDGATVTATVRVSRDLQERFPTADLVRDVRIERDGDTLRVANAHLGESDAEDWHVALEIEVPYELDVECKVGVGDVHVDGVVKGVTIEAGVGDVTVDGLDGALAVDVGTGNARIRAASLDGGSVTTGVGNIDVEVSGSGPTGELRCESGTGGVSLALPAGVAADVTAEAGVGSVRVEGLGGGITVEERVTGGSARGAVNGGGPTIRLTTGVGDIRVAGRE